MENRNLILVVVVVVLLALGLVTYYFVTQRGIPVQLPGTPTQPESQEPSPLPLAPESPEATPTIPTP